LVLTVVSIFPNMDLSYRIVLHVKESMSLLKRICTVVSSVPATNNAGMIPWSLQGHAPIIPPPVTAVLESCVENAPKMP